MTIESLPETIGDYVSLRRDGRIVHVTFDRGDNMNALNAELMQSLTATAQLLQQDINSSVVILSGEGAFSAGADLKANRAILSKDSDMTLLARRQALKLGPDMCAAWEQLEQITIAAIESFCVGGGVALAAACDHRVAGEDALFYLPEVPLGMQMSWQSNPRAVALIGPSRAKRFVILGEKLLAPTALEWGLIDECVKPGGSLAAATALAERYAALPPVPLRMAKQAINAAAGALNYTASYADRDQFLLTTTSDDLQEGIGAFLEKRKPDFSGN